MGKMFSGLTTEGLQESQDRVGGGFEAMPSGIYDGTIKVAYVTNAANSKAQAINLLIDVNGKELRGQIWFTNREGENFYPDKNDSKKRNPLPGYTTIDDLCLLTTGDGLVDQNTEEKVVKMYDPVERKEVNKPAPVLVELLGKPVKMGVLREITFKQKKDDSGVYKDTDETRTDNTIDKFFHHETGRTVNEYRHEVMTPEFMEAWDTANTGKDRDRTKGKTGAAAAGGTTGSGRPSPFGGAGAAAGEKKKSLFGK